MRVGLLLLVLLLGTGCLIDRSSLTSDRDSGAPGLDAPGLDAPGLDAPRFDTGSGCVPIDCNDANPCTDDLCTASGCTHTNNASPCDDRVLCNGGDTCGGGTCSVHDGVDPCTPPTVCAAGLDRCLGCRDSSDCPARMEGVPGSCGAPVGDFCAPTGTASRSVTTYTCVAGACEASTVSEDVPCSRDVEGSVCAPADVTDFGACTYTDACTTTGSRTRTTTTHTCAAGTCGSSTEIEVDVPGCDRATEGSACGAETPSDWSLCGGFSDACDTSGTRTRSVNVPVCMGGACGTRMRVDTEPCTRSTDGIVCGTETCGAFGPCTRVDASSCNGAGNQSRTCTTPACGGGTCGGSAMRTETQSCTVSLGGVACTPPMGCTPCLEVGMTRCRSGREGARICSDGMGGTCTGFGACLDADAATEICTCP